MSRKRRKPEKIVAKLRRLGCRRLSVWPRHPHQDPAAQETHYRSGQSRDPRTRSRQTPRTLAALLWIVVASAVRPKPLGSVLQPRQ